MAYGRRRTGGKRSYAKKGRMSRTKRKSGSSYRGFSRNTGAYKRFDSKGYLPPGVTRELKFAQASEHYNTGPANPGIILPTTAGGSMCVIPQGSKAYEREGRKIVISEINLRCFVVNVLAGAKESISHRFILVLDSQCNGTAATPVEVLNSNALAPQGLVWAAKNHYNGNRFKFILDETWTSDPVTDAANSAQTSHNIIKSFKTNIPIIWNDQSATTGAIAQIKSNNLFCIYLNSSAGNADFMFNYELRYYDD